MDGSEARTGSDTARPRRSDVQGKLYNFLNRSAQSLSRSNSQSGRTRRVKDREAQAEAPADHLDPPRASHAAPSRLPLISNNTPETNRGARLSTSTSARTSRSATDAAQSLPPKSSSPPPLTPRLQSRYTPSSTPQPKTSPTAYSYNTPPQTPLRSRKYSTPSSPNAPTSPAKSTSGGGGPDLLLTRPLARPITPSNPTSGRKVFGIPIPSPTSRKATLGVADSSPNRYTHKLRSGSGSSNEPLLHNRSPTTPSSSSTPGSTQRTDRTPLPTPASSLPRSHRSAASGSHDADPPPTSPTTTSSRRGTPKLDFWRSAATPRAPSSQGDHREKEKRRGVSISQSEQADLVSPQPRAPATFLPPIPHLHRTPPTPQKEFERERERDGPGTLRLDSFMSDSMPIRQNIVKELEEGEVGLGRQPAFTTRLHPLRNARTPAPIAAPKEKPSPGLGIQRSNSAPGTRGRLSPCLRIPSPKFLNREKSKEREREKDKDKEREKRRVTPESVGAPILRDAPRTHVHHTRTHAQAHVHINETGGKGPGVKAPKTSLSLLQLRRAAHGTFDFERPGSRTSSKSGADESKGTRSDDEKENMNIDHRERDKETNARDREDGERVQEERARLRLKMKATSPVPPLPTPRLGLKPRSPPPARARARSPLPPPPMTASTVATNTTHHTHTHAHADDSALPRLSSSLARRNSSSNTHSHQYHPSHHASQSHQIHRTHAHGYRAPASLPHFSFEPAAPSPASPSGPKRAREVGGQYVDTRTGLIMYAPKSDGGRRGASPGVSPTRIPTRNGVGRMGASPDGDLEEDELEDVEEPTTKISPEELEEATAVITQFRGALNEAGFATLQKYVRRYDAQHIPLDGPAGLLARVQRLLDTSAPRVDERRKRVLFESFVRVVTQVS